MRKPTQDRLLQRGVWLLVVGVFTCWLLGIGLFFILAAAVCGFVGLFREQMARSALLFLSAVVCFAVGIHVATVAGIFTFNYVKAHHQAQLTPR